jgi:hypothetical protein
MKSSWICNLCGADGIEDIRLRLNYLLTEAWASEIQTVLVLTSREQLKQALKFYLISLGLLFLAIFTIRLIPYSYIECSVVSGQDSSNLPGSCKR